MSLAAPRPEESPFRITPNPRFVYRGQLDEARRRVLAAVAAGRDVAILGEPGMGKTLLLRLLAQDCPAAERRLAAAGPGFDPAPLTASAGQGGAVVLVDEAHAASARELRALWEGVRARRAAGETISLVLAGRPQLEAAAAEAELAVSWFWLSRLKPEEIPGLVRRRLADAGLSPRLFCDAALAAVALRSRGVPRLVNLLCSGALFHAEQETADCVAEAHVLAAAEAFELREPASESPPLAPAASEAAIVPPGRLGWRALATGLGLFVGGLVGLALLLAVARSDEPPAALAAEDAPQNLLRPGGSGGPHEPNESAVIVHYSSFDRTGERTARRVAAHLAAEGFEVRGVRAVRVRLASTTVRYFFDADRRAVAQAQRAAAAALRRSGAAAPRAQDLTHYEPKPPQGTLELWVGRQASSPRVRAAAMAPFPPKRQFP